MFVNMAMKFQIKMLRISWHRWKYQLLKLTLLPVVSLRVSVGRQTSLFFTVNWLLMSFRVSFHAAVCQCVSVMILGTELYYLLMQFQSATRPLFSWLYNAPTVCVRSQGGSYTSCSSSFLFRVIYLYVYVYIYFILNHKLHNLISTYSLILEWM
jgi:hypothetical protein